MRVRKEDVTVGYSLRASGYLTGKQPHKNGGREGERKGGREGMDVPCVTVVSLLPQGLNPPTTKRASNRDGQKHSQMRKGEQGLTVRRRDLLLGRLCLLHDRQGLPYHEQQRVSNRNGQEETAEKNEDAGFDPSRETLHQAHGHPTSLPHHIEQLAVAEAEDRDQVRAVLHGFSDETLVLFQVEPDEKEGGRREGEREFRKVEVEQKTKATRPRLPSPLSPPHSFPPSYRSLSPPTRNISATPPTVTAQSCPSSKIFLIFSGLAGRHPIQAKKCLRPGRRKMTLAPIEPTRLPGKSCLVIEMEITSVKEGKGRERETGVGGWMG